MDAQCTQARAGIVQKGWVGYHHLSAGTSPQHKGDFEKDTGKCFLVLSNGFPLVSVLCMGYMKLLNFYFIKANYFGICYTAPSLTQTFLCQMLCYQQPATVSISTRNWLPMSLLLEISLGSFALLFVDTFFLSNRTGFLIWALDIGHPVSSPVYSGEIALGKWHQHGSGWANMVSTWGHSQDSLLCGSVTFTQQQPRQLQSETI